MEFATRGFEGLPPCTTSPVATPSRRENEITSSHIHHGTHVAQICWFLLAGSIPASPSVADFAAAQEEVANTVGSLRIIDLDLSRYDRIANALPANRTTTCLPESGIATRNPFPPDDRADQSRSPVRAPMLLVGPTGAGKVLSRARVFELKRRASGRKDRFHRGQLRHLRSGSQPCRRCLATARRAFTGAQQERSGLLRSPADGGLLFLDEIGELGLDRQAMLLKTAERKSASSSVTGSEQRLQLIVGTITTCADGYASPNSGRPLRPHQSMDLRSARPRWPSGRHRPNLDYELERYARKTASRCVSTSRARRRYLAFATEEARWRQFPRGWVPPSSMPGHSGDRRTNPPKTSATKSRLASTWGRRSDAGRLCPKCAPPRREKLDLFDRCQLSGHRGLPRQPRLSGAGRRLFVSGRKKQNNDADRLRKLLGAL